MQTPLPPPTLPNQQLSRWGFWQQRVVVMPPTPCGTHTQESVGLVAPAMEVGSSLAAETGRTAQEQWPPVHPGSTPSYGISFIKCRGSCWQPRRLAAFVSSLCGRVSSTWQPERSDQRESDLGFVSVAGHLAEGQPSLQMHAGLSPFLEYGVQGKNGSCPPTPATLSPYWLRDCLGGALALTLCPNFVVEPPTSTQPSFRA